MSVLSALPFPSSLRPSALPQIRKPDAPDTVQFTGWMQQIADRSVADGARWTPEQAQRWFANQALPVGCNFIPSNAVNQLEMWQAETFDPATLDRELGFARDLGMNTVRVYLHNLLWEQDAAGFKGRIDQFLSLADKHGLKTMFVLFDSCWNDNPQLGKQPEPVPGVHNSGWVQAPGRERLQDPSTWKGLEDYTRDILGSFGQDRRVLAWDVYNEPSNGEYGDAVMPLLRKTFEWAKQANPSQPLTAGRWEDHASSNEFILKNSDIITFHNYETPDKLEAQIEELEELHRPLICTEYMARPAGSRFETCLPVFAEHHVGAINWGLVQGKTNTIYGWDDVQPDGKEPDVWFHDILRPDGTPFSPAEVEFLKQHNGHLAGSKR